MGIHEYYLKGAEYALARLREGGQKDTMRTKALQQKNEHEQRLRTMTPTRLWYASEQWSILFYEGVLSCLD